MSDHEHETQHPPKGDKHGKRRRRDDDSFDVLSMLPNVVTLLALGCGLTAIREAMAGRYGLVIILIVAEAILDGLDGRLARMLGAQSEMGVQLDSLCDAIGFGIGPAFVTYSVAQQGANRLMSTVAWFAAMVYAAAIVLRLARFNTLLEDENRPLFHKEFFVGVPAPAAAWLALTPVVAHQAFGEGFWSSSWFCSAWLVFIGVLAFSRIPTYSFKKWLLTRRQTAFLLFGAALAIAGLFTWPYIDMLAILVLYVATIPFAIRRYRWLLAHPQAWDEIGYKIPKRSRRAGVKPRARRWRQV